MFDGEAAHRELLQAVHLGSQVEGSVLTPKDTIRQ
jgi:hypothetical protein